MRLLTHCVQWGRHQKANFEKKTGFVRAASALRIHFNKCCQMTQELKIHPGSRQYLYTRHEPRLRPGKEGLLVSRVEPVRPVKPSGPSNPSGPSSLSGPLILEISAWVCTFHMMLKSDEKWRFWGRGRETDAQWSPAMSKIFWTISMIYKYLQDVGRKGEQDIGMKGEPNKIMFLGGWCQL